MNINQITSLSTGLVKEILTLAISHAQFVVKQTNQDFYRCFKSTWINFYMSNHTDGGFNFADKRNASMVQRFKQEVGLDFYKEIVKKFKKLFNLLNAEGHPYVDLLIAKDENEIAVHIKASENSGINPTYTLEGKIPGTKLIYGVVIDLPEGSDRIIRMLKSDFYDSANPAVTYFLDNYNN